MATFSTRRRSLGASVSFSTIDAMISTSYGVSFFERAYARFTFAQLRQNVATCCCTSERDDVVRKKS